MFVLGRRRYDLKLKWSDHNEIWLKLFKKYMYFLRMIEDFS